MTTATKSPSRRGVIAGTLAALVVAAIIAVMRQRAAPDLIVQSDEGWAGEMRAAIAGEVVSPGAYTLRGDARLADLIAAAGGYTDAANRDVLNPAARVGDGQSYTIPVLPTPAPRAATSTARAATTTPPTLSPPPSASPPMPSPPPGAAVTGLQTVVAAQAALPLTPVPGSASAATPTRTPPPGPPPPAPRSPTVTPAMAAPAGVVNVNTATRAELEALPLIGPALADRIIADRTANGPYRTVDDLARVRGISPRTVEQLRGKIRV